MRRDVDERQVRAARGLLGWSQAVLSEASGVSVPTIKRLEDAAERVKDVTLAAVVEACEEAGVAFLGANPDGAGVGVAISRGVALVDRSPKNASP